MTIRNITLALFSSVITLSVSAQEQNGGTKVFDVVVQNETRVNSEDMEFSPTFYEDGILFISSRENAFKFIDRRLKSSTMSVFLSKRDTTGGLQKPVFFKQGINTKYHEGPLCFDVSGSDMYFTRSNYVRGKAVKSTDGWINLVILKATRVGDSWENERELPFNGKDFNTCHPSISPDGDRIYFASDRPGGFGGLDIYYVEKQGDDFGDPVNLGATINSDMDEIFPFIHADGTLFFSSNGWEGEGGLDLYYSRMVDGTWLQARNLASPFNSEKDDFGFILDLETKNGYFSSNRIGTKGQDDIYSFHCSQGLKKLLEDREKLIAAKPKNFRIFVADNATGAELPNTMVSMWDLEDMNLKDVLTITDEKGNLIRIMAPDPESTELVLKVDMVDSEIKGTTDLEGMFETDLKPASYVIAVKAEGFFPKQVVVEPESNLEEILILLDPLGSAIGFNGKVIDPRTNRPIAGAKVSVTDDASGETTILYTDRNGNFEHYLPRDRDFTVIIEKDGQSTTRSVTTRNKQDNTPIAMAFDITDPFGRGFRTGDVVELPNIYYNFNDASIRPDARKDLDALAALLNEIPGLQIELASHTDSRGSESYNLALSQRRADNAMAYLLDHGVPAERMQAAGYGESQIKNQCKDGVRCADKDHQINRRTEFRVLDGNTNLATSSDPVGQNTSTENPDTDLATQGTEEVTTLMFRLIAGAFKMKTNADRRLEELIAKGYTSAMIQTNPAGLQTVVVSEFPNREQAELARKELESKHSIKAFVQTK